MVEYFNPECAAHDLVDMTARLNAAAEVLMLSRNEVGKIATRFSLPEDCAQALNGISSFKLDAIRALQDFGISEEAIDELEDAAADLAAKSRRRERHRLVATLDASPDRFPRTLASAIEIAEQRLVRAFAAVVAQVPAAPPTPHTGEPR